MLNASMLSWRTLALVAAIVGSAPFAMSAESSLRRLQFSDNHVEWISEAAVDALRELSHTHSIDGAKDIATLRKTYGSLVFGISDEALTALTTHRGFGPGFIDTTETYKTRSTSDQKSAAVTAPAYATVNASAHPEVQTMFAKVQSSELKYIIGNMSTTLATRYYKSTISRNASVLVQNYMNTALGSSSSVTLFENTFNQPNVIGRIPAADNSTSTEVIILGGHLDSTSQSASTKAPGADDDASGVAVVLSVLRILTELGWRGKYAIEGQAFAGEEGGLLGSSKLAASYKAAGKTVRGMLMVEMIGWQPQTSTNKGKSSTITVLSDPVAGMTTHMKSVVSAYVPTAELRSVACGYGCSDHYSFYDNGYPVVCIAAYGPNDSNLNPHYHTTGDTADTVDYDKMVDFVKATLAWIVEISS